MPSSIKLKSPLVPGVSSPRRYLHTNQVTSCSSFLQSKQIVLLKSCSVGTSVFYFLLLLFLSCSSLIILTALSCSFSSSSTLLQVQTSDWRLAAHDHWPPSALHAPGAHTGSLTCTGPQSTFGCSFAGCPHCPQMHKYLHTWLCIDTGGPCCVSHSVTCSIRGTASIFCIFTTRFQFHHNKKISLVWQV